MNSFDVIIVGAGPGGSLCAKTLAKAGYKVIMYDRRAEIGNPKRCGEGLDKKAEELTGPIPERCIAQHIKGARIYAPNGKYLEATVDYGGYVLERKVFDKWMATEAVKTGAKLQTDTLITDLIIENGVVKGVRGNFVGQPFEARAKIVVCATGAESPLPQKAGIATACKLNLIDTCIQYEMIGVKIDPDFIHIYMGNKIAPRGYVWIFPKGDTVNVGIGIVPGSKTPKEYLDAWISGRPEFKGASVIEVNAGIVPVGGLLKDMVADGFVVLGEAAHHVNAIHGGGMKEAMFSGKIAAEVIDECLNKGDVSKQALSKFNERWWKERGEKLERVERLREVVEKLSDEDMNDLAEALKPQDLIDFAGGARLSVLAKVLMRKPSLVALARHLF
ncbi:MAG: NAD(P)/FAD-dependent oxidoreductase [Candidatus Aenigmatarchaeota archaeon]